MYKYTNIGSPWAFPHIATSFPILTLLPWTAYLRLHVPPNLRVRRPSTPKIPENINHGYTRDMPIRYTHVSSPRDFIRNVKSGKISILHLFCKYFEFMNTLFLFDIYLVHGYW